jgi:hypothetical protein
MEIRDRAKEAKRILGRVANGADPAEAKKAKRHAESVNELCDLYCGRESGTNPNEAKET